MDIDSTSQRWATSAPMIVDSPSILDETKDNYTLGEHMKMDEKVLAKLKKLQGQWRENPSPLELWNVLHLVMEGDPRLDRKWLDVSDQIPDGVWSIVNEAWKAGSFQRVRICCCLQRPKDTLAQEEFAAFEEAMTHDYKGVAVNAFIEYLKRNDRAFNATSEYYAKFCSITQSSGTGKTRLLFELGKKDICVLYMNIRPLQDAGYPPRDTIPAEILTEYCISEQQYYAKCQIFFATIFKCLAVFLQESDSVAVLSNVNNKRRIQFLENVQREFVSVEREVLWSSPFKVLNSYITKLAYTFRQTRGDSPKVIIALDDDHELHEKWESRQYLRATVLRQVIKDYSFRAEFIWVVFASAQTWKIAHHTYEPQALLPSARVPLQGNLLFPPFILLGWDQHTPVLGEVELDNVGWGSHILRYGRPLWWSLRGRFTLAQVLELARQKLCSLETFNPKLRFHAFAVLGQRLSLDIPFGRLHAFSDNETLVASHLRILIEETENRLWNYTTYPSEPILSAVAADWLHKDENLFRSLATLLDMVKEGFISAGETGALASRTLWFLARDFCVHKDHESASKPPFASNVVKNDFELPYCRPVPVIEFLQLVFGPHILDNAPDARKVFQDAYINFSHWVQMKSHITGDGSRDDASIEEWTECLWARTSAIWCCYDDHVIDKVIPIYFKSQPRGSRMSHILISDTARDNSQHDLLDTITRKHENIAPDHNGPPYIVILADLGLSSSCDVVVRNKSMTDDPCLRIYAPGLDKKTYPFLPDDIASILNALYRQSVPSAPALLQDLEAQVQFGWSREARYMNFKE